MIVHDEQPFNAERGLAALAELLTATNAFYVRGHGDVPDIDLRPGRGAGGWPGRVAVDHPVTHGLEGWVGLGACQRHELAGSAVSGASLRGVSVSATTSSIRQSHCLARAGFVVQP